ncbi:putative GTP-binding protein LepA [Teladorsagia circumcincta]|uniref:Putative GTP-binding protein LepA n=1 Tax=Teladorsagia circumcincta TaxID=45464 RepID=A0A2G9V0C7_TELCI|nr:putative GTP-binding protein LepA [Teladorsagia circumcincta]
MRFSKLRVSVKRLSGRPTIANFWLAFEKNIQMIPVINKIDLSGANVPKVETQLKNLFEFDPHECIKISAKSGHNVEKLFDLIIERIPPPKSLSDAPFRAQIFDSMFDHFRGAIAFIRVADGSIQKGQKIQSYHNAREYDVLEVGIMRPDMTPCAALSAGQVGYVICGMKTVKDNETIRKKRFDGKGEISIIDASKFPEESDIEKFLEPVVTVRIIVPAEMMGVVNGLCSECRGERGDVSSIDESRLMIVWRLPLAEVVIDFFERLKRITSGYASFDYEQDGYMETKLIKLTLTINGREVPEFSQIIPAAMAKERAKLLVHRLKREIPRQQFEVTVKGEN